MLSIDTEARAPLDRISNVVPYRRTIIVLGSAMPHFIALLGSLPLAYNFIIAATSVLWT
jgi:hypothetical protein